jgi:purine-binding chemotaxis protein CheW
VIQVNPEQADQAKAGDESARTSQSLGGKYMTFQLAAEDYGIEILKVREIIGLMEITRVPRVPDFVRGVINLRGRVIPVIDLRLKFGMEATAATEQTVIIVAHCQIAGRALTMGVLVDRVLEVLNIEGAQIEPPPDLGESRTDGDFILGVGKAAHRVVFLLDIAKVLSGAEAAELASAARPS